MTKIGLTIIAICAYILVSENQGKIADAEQLSRDLYLIHDDCNNALNDQVGWELYASLVYMNMAGYFGKPTVARPGFAKFFKDQSLEEYTHASKFIDYINKRNGTVRRLSVEDSPKSDWSSPVEALNDAIKLEKHVYAKIQHIHNMAEIKCQDGHLTDFLDTYFITEQVDSIRELQEMLSTLSVADQAAATMIEYMEDVKLRQDAKKEL